ncbi:MAG TPA: hypothetical protein DCM87_06050 [Planctomycetes bacterium]|nr:hypothetical protein [Planctomycetota bacterium]
MWELIRDDVAKGCAQRYREGNAATWWFRPESEVGRVLTRVLALQLPEDATRHADALKSVATLRGERAYLVSCAHNPEGVIADYVEYVVLWNDGTIRGRPFGFVHGGDLGFDWLAHKDAARGDVVQAAIYDGGDYEFQFDAKGVVPLGYVLGGGWNWDASMLVSTACTPAWARSRKSMPYVSFGDTAQLLASGDVGDILRGLYNLENEDLRAVGRAAPLLAHADPQVRARAAAILANDPEACNAVLPLRNDQVPRVSATAHVAALSCANVEEARNSFIHLLGKGHIAQLFHSRFDFARLRDARVARAILERIDGYVPEQEALRRANPNYTREDDLPDGLAACIDSLRKEELAPSLPLLVAVWERLRATSAYVPDDVAHSVLRALARAEEKAADACLVRSLAGAELKEPALGMLFGALGERTPPLPEALAMLEKSAGTVQPIGDYRQSDYAPSSRSLTVVLLVKWRAPGAFERLLDACIEFVPPWDFLCKTSREPWQKGLRWGEVLCRALTLDEKRRFLAEALVRPDLFAEHAAAVLAWGAQDELGELDPGLLQLWDSMLPEGGVFNAFSAALVRQRRPAIDAHMAAALKIEDSVRTSAVLVNWLAWRREEPVAGATALVEDVLKRTTWKNPFRYAHWDPEPRWLDELRGDREPGDETEHEIADVDRHLAAQLLLVAWNAPGADARLLEFVRREGAMPLYDEFFREFALRRLGGELREVARSVLATKKPDPPPEEPKAKAPSVPATGPWREIVDELKRQRPRDLEQLPELAGRLRKYLRGAVEGLGADSPRFIAFGTDHATGAQCYEVLCVSRDPRRTYANLVVVNSEGRVLGPPFRFALVPEGERLSRALSWGDDAKGVVPFGFEKGGARASSEAAAKWVLAVGAKPYEDTAALLRSSDVNAIYRGLYNLEFDDRAAIKLALPLLKHPDIGIRKRAVAVLANDPATCAAAGPLRESTNASIRGAAILTCMYADDPAIARMSFMRLLRYDKVPWAQGSFGWLNDARLARAVLGSLEGGTFREYAEALLALLPAEALRPLAERLIALRVGERKGLASLDALVRIESPTADAFLARCLVERRLPGEVPRARLLSALAVRAAPIPAMVEPLTALAHEDDGAIEALDEGPFCHGGPDDARLLAVIILLKWRVPGAFDGAIEAIERRLDCRSVKKDASWARRWWTAFDTEGRRRLFAAAADCWEVGQMLVRILGWCERREVLEFRAEVLRLWAGLDGESDASEELTGVLAGLEDPEVDARLLEELPDSLRAANVLFHLLRLRAARPITAFTAVLEKLAGEDISVSDDASFYREDCRADPSIAFREQSGRESLRFSLDQPLAAALLLLNWKAPKAEERIMRMLRKEGPDCLFDFLWEVGPPPPMGAALRAFAAKLSREYRERVEAILAPRS